MIDESAKSVVVRAFRGYGLDLNPVSGDMAQDMKNFVIDEVPGELTNRRGSGLLFANGPMPYSDYSVSPPTGQQHAHRVMTRRSSDEIVAHEGFYVPEQGGRFINVCIMKYRFRQLTAGEAYIYSYGIFVRPYWNGTTWLEYWVELSEFWDFQIYAVNGTNNEWLQVDDDPVNWRFGFTPGYNVVFPRETFGAYGTGLENQYYFRGWTIENLEAARNTERFCRCLSQRCTTTDGGTGYGILELEIPHDGAANSAYNRLNWATANKIRVHRNYVYQENRFSASDDIVCDPHVYAIDDGMRITNKRGTNKARFRVGYEEHGWAATNFPKEQIANGIVLADQFIDPFPPAIWVGYDPAAVTGASTGLAAGTYRLRYSVLEGRNWSKLYICPKWDSGNSRWDATDDSGVTIALDDKIVVDLRLYTTAVSRKVKMVRVYLEDPASGYFYRALDIDLTVDLDTASSDDILTDYWDGSTAWAVYGINQTFDVVSNDGAEGSVDIGRAITEDGICYYDAAAPVGNKVLFSAATKNDIEYPSRVFISPAGGDGQIQNDIVDLAATSYFDTQTGDANAVVAIAGIRDYALVLTQQTHYLLSLLGSKANWRFETIDSYDGIASAKSLVVLQDRAYWAGNFGVYMFGLGRGVNLLVPYWHKTYKALAGKSSAMAAYDANTGRYYLYVDSKLYAFPLRTPGVEPFETMIFEPNKTPTWLAHPPVNFLAYATSDHYLLAAGTGSQDYTGVNVACEWTSNPIRIPENLVGDQLVLGFSLVYDSPVDITIALYKDGTLHSTRTCPLAETTYAAYFDLGGLCEEFYIKLSATTDGAAQTIRIKKMEISRMIVPSLGQVV
jgi:hypothetical protein